MRNKIKVAVVDSGIDSNHPLLKGSVKGGVEIYFDKDGKIKYGKRDAPFFWTKINIVF